MWQGRGASGFRSRVPSMARARVSNRSYASGMRTDRAAASRRYVSTTRNGENVEGMGGAAWKARRAATTAARTSGSRIRATGMGSASMNRVIRHSSSGRNATTSGPTPAESAASAAARSARRSMPRIRVSFPASRTTNRSPSTSTR